MTGKHLNKEAALSLKRLHPDGPTGESTWQDTIQRTSAK